MPMKFSENIKQNYFLSQPHQPFFLLAFLNAIAIMFIFMLSFKGILPLNMSATDYHAYGFIYLLFTPAFFGFLFTTFPRFSSTPVIEQKLYLKVFALYAIGSTFVILGTLATPLLTKLGMLITFGGHLSGFLILKNIYQKTTIPDTYDLQWITIAMGIGVMAHALFIISSFLEINMTSFTTEIAIYLYLFLVAFTVAQRMVPFFSHSPIEKHTERFKVIVGLLMLHIILELITTHASFLADFILAYLLGREIYRWRLPFPNPNPLVWILHIALFWIPVAFLLSSISSLITLINGNSFLYLGIHTLALGFLLTIVIGFGTRVTLGHSGNMMHANRYTTFLFYWTQVVVFSRILTSLATAFGWDFMILFDITATVWILLFVAWGIRFFSVLVIAKKL